MSEVVRSYEIFCRPCHNGFVAETTSVLPPDAEVLYISKPVNVEIDLHGFVSRRVKAPACPEGERVYRIQIPLAKEVQNEGRLGTYGTCEPMPVIDGPEPYKTRVNNLVARAYVIGWWDHGNDEEMKQLSKEWERLNKEFKIEL